MDRKFIVLSLLTLLLSQVTAVAVAGAVSWYQFRPAHCQLDRQELELRLINFKLTQHWLAIATEDKSVRQIEDDVQYAELEKLYAQLGTSISGC